MIAIVWNTVLILRIVYIVFLVSRPRNHFLLVFSVFFRFDCYYSTFPYHFLFPRFSKLLLLSSHLMSYHFIMHSSLLLSSLPIICSFSPLPCSYSLPFLWLLHFLFTYYALFFYLITYPLLCAYLLSHSLLVLPFISCLLSYHIFLLVISLIICLFIYLYICPSIQTFVYSIFLLIYPLSHLPLILFHIPPFHLSIPFPVHFPLSHFLIPLILLFISLPFPLISFSHSSPPYSSPTLTLPPIFFA